MKKNVVKGVLALVDQAFVSLNNFVTFILVSKFCPDGLSLYVLAWSIFNVLRVIQERGLAAPYFVLAHEPDRDGKTFLGSSLILQFIFGLATCGLFAVLALVFGYKGTPIGMAGCCLALIFASPAILLRDHLRAVSCAHFRYGVAVFLSVSAMVLQIAVILLTFYVGYLNAAVVFLAMGIASLLPGLAWLVKRPEAFEFQKQRVKPDWAVTQDYSKWLVAARFFPSAAMGVMPWVVMWAVNKEAAGLLGGCLTLANISNMFVFGANNFFFPRAAKAYKKNGALAMTKELWQTVFVFSFVLSALCLFYYFLGDFVLVKLFNESFAGNAPLVAALGLSYLIVSYSTIAGYGMTAMGRPEGLFWGELAFGIVAFFAGVLLTLQFGLMGTAAAMCLASLFATVVETVYLIRLLKADANDAENQSA